MRLVVVVLLGSLMLASCARSQTPFRNRYGEPKPILAEHWKHETKSLRDFDADLYECQKDNPTLRVQKASEMRERCLLSKGWERR